MKTPASTLNSEIKLATIFNNTLFGFIIFDKEGVIEAINQAAVSLFGYDEKELLAGDFRSFIADSDKSKFDNYLLLLRQSKAISPSSKKKEIKVIGRDGKAFFIDLEITDAATAEERFFIGIIKDISKRKKLESEVQKQKETKKEVIERLEEEKELSELKTRFLSIASHEFRTPLAGILSSLQLIKRYLKAEYTKWEALANREKIETHFDKIEKSIANLTHILNDFLSLNKLEENKVTVKYEKFNLREFLENACHEMRLLCKSGQEIEYNHYKKESEVYIDTHILKNIIYNLLSNAIKYSPENKPISLKSEITDNIIKIEIKDRGIGIPPKDQKHLFGRFFRAENANAYPGTGLGLSIVKKYVGMMQGSITFESQENLGTSFYLIFPLNKEN